MTQSQIRKKITKRDWKTYFKKRWLYLLGALFIYVAPLVIIFEALMRIEPNQTNISISFLGFVTGITYLVFFSKRLNAKIKELKTGALKTFLTGLISLIPFITVGFLAHLINNGIANFKHSIWGIIASMFIGVVCQTIDYLINADYLYGLELKKIAADKIFAEQEEERLRTEIEALRGGGNNNE